MKKIVLIGAGGHCKVIIDIIKSTNEYEIVGITDKKSELNNIFGIPIIGDDSKLKQMHDRGVCNAFICIGALNNNNLRNIVYKNLKDIGFTLPILIHKSSIVSKSVQMEEGTCIMPGAVVNAGVCIGKNCIINTGAIIEHDCNIGINTHMSPKACIGGGAQIGNNCQIGLGSSIIQEIKIGNNVTIGAGAVVIDNLEDNVLACGVPAKVIKVRREYR